MLSQDSCHNGSHLASTYSALAILKIVGYDLANIDSNALLSSMKKLQQPDGRQVFRFGLPSHSYQTCILLHLLTLSREQLHPPFILFYDFFNILQLVPIPDCLSLRNIYVCYLRLMLHSTFLCTKSCCLIETYFTLVNATFAYFYFWPQQCFSMHAFYNGSWLLAFCM